MTLEPKDRAKNDAIILEFKARSPREPDLEAAVQKALEQIEERGYAKELAGTRLRGGADPEVWPRF